MISPSMLEQLRSLHPNINILLLDFDLFPFEHQLAVVRRTDVLMGVHGDLLAHTLFLRKGAILMEIVRERDRSKQYEHLAKLKGVKYCFVRAEDDYWANSEKEEMRLSRETFSTVISVIRESLRERGRWVDSLCFDAK